MRRAQYVSIWAACQRYRYHYCINYVSLTHFQPHQSTAYLQHVPYAPATAAPPRVTSLSGCPFTFPRGFLLLTASCHLSASHTRTRAPRSTCLDGPGNGAGGGPDGEQLCFCSDRDVATGRGRPVGLEAYINLNDGKEQAVVEMIRLNKDFAKAVSALGSHNQWISRHGPLALGEPNGLLSLQAHAAAVQRCGS